MLDFKVATTIGKLHITQVKEAISVSDIPDFMLNNLNLLKLKSRTLSKSQQLMFSFNKAESSNEFDYDEFIEEKEANIGSVHPMDIFLLIFFSCNKLYRQKFIIKTAKCQLSLPLVAFDPFSKRLTIYSFSLQNLFKECFLGEKQFEFPIVDQAMNIVSAIRIGNEGMKKSKSKVLNDLLNVSHDYFFHRNCEGSVCTNYLLNGTIEIGWYLPSGKEDSFDEPSTYLNLRGDATNLERQLTLLSLISNVILLFISPIDFSVKNIQVIENMFEQIYSRSDVEQVPQIILIVESLGRRYDLRKLKNYKPNQLNLIRLGNNEADDISKIISGIKNGLTISTKKYCINDITDQAQKMQILSEVANEEEFQKISEEIQSLISFESNKNPSEINLALLKKSMFQLQGDSWKKIAENYRNYYRTSEENQHHFQILGMDHKIREVQLDYLISNPSGSIQYILSKVNEYTFKNFEIFWRIFQNELDKLAKYHIPKLYEKYKEERDMLFKLSKTNQFSNQERFNERLEMLSQDISDSSFGIEHLFREFGQIYEVCMHFLSTEYNEKVKSLQFDPKDLLMMASQLLLSGVQLEILDGDVSHIPTRWISDILFQVSELVGQSKRVYVISVLGIQSSGKSTLLNTMFGLDFAVSAGRCTKGAFMHLISIEEEASTQLGYDYLLIVDTEGLRAPELTAQESYLHDNEIATFAIGLADLTIINILGEYSTEMQDILQITIYALIRMKKTNCNPKCVFVHQNASARNMENKLAISTRKFVQLLDEITLTAAKNEKVSDKFQTFNSVIEFNPQEDIFYFPTLFRGDPPMASINPGYSEAADKLRHVIFSNSLKFSQYCPTLRNIALKIVDLWNSIMEEDFVFNYRNVQELNILYELDYAQTQWTALFTQQLSGWVNRMVKYIRIMEGQELEKFWERVCAELRDQKNKICMEEQNNIKATFFKNHSRKDFLSSRETISDNYFTSLRENEFNYSLLSLGEIYNKQKSLRAIRNMFNDAQGKLLKKMQSELERRKNSLAKLTNTEIINIFNNKWTELIQGIPKQKRKEHVDIRFELKKLLINSPLLHDVTRGDKEAKLEDFSNYIKSCTLNPFVIYDRYIHVTLLIGTDCECNEKVIVDNKEEIIHGKLKCIVEHVKRECDELVSKKCTSNMYFSISYFEWIIEIVKKICVNESNSCGYNLPNLFINDLTFYECCKRVTHFERLQEEYIQSVSVSEMVEERKLDYQNYFIIKWKGFADEIIAGLDLSTTLFREIINLVSENQVKFMLHYFRKEGGNFSNKVEILIYILRDLCLQENINEYIMYLKNPSEYIEFWILNKIRHFYYNIDNRNIIIRKFEEEVKALVNYTMDSANNAIDSVRYRDKMDTSAVQNEWKKRFTAKILTKIYFNASDEFNFFDNHKINDYDRFIGAFKDNLGNFEIKFEPLMHCIEMKDQLVRSYITCTRTCIFCNELCMRNGSNHSHSCGTFHRPHCLNSKNIRKYEREALTTQIILLENPNQTDLDNESGENVEIYNLMQERKRNEALQRNLQNNLLERKADDANPKTISESQLPGNTSDVIPKPNKEFIINPSDYHDCSTKVLKREKFFDERGNSADKYQYFAPGWEIYSNASKKSIYWKWVVANFHQELFLPDIQLSRNELSAWEHITKDQVIRELEDLLLRYCNRWFTFDIETSNIVACAVIRTFNRIFPFLRKPRY